MEGVKEVTEDIQLSEIVRTEETETASNEISANETTTERIARVVLREEFRPLNQAGNTIFLPSNIFPNNDRRVTVEETNEIFDTLHLITGRVCNRENEDEQRELHTIINSILDEARRYTRTRICQKRDVEACQHWEWKVNGRIVESYKDIDEVLKSKWTTTRGTMIQQCHTLMHGMYQTKKSVGWFSEGVQGFLDLKKIKLYKTKPSGEKVLLERNNVGRLLSFAKQARAKINRERNNLLSRYQGIKIFSGKRARVTKNHTNKKQVNKFDGGCDGYYIDSTDAKEHARSTLASLLSDGHTEEELVEMLDVLKRNKKSLPTTNAVQKEGRASQGTRDALLGMKQLYRRNLPEQSKEEYESQNAAFLNALQDDDEDQRKQKAIPTTVAIREETTEFQATANDMMDRNQDHTRYQVQQSSEEYEAQGVAFLHALKNNNDHKNENREAASVTATATVQQQKKGESNTTTNNALDSMTLDLQTEGNHVVDDGVHAGDTKGNAYNQNEYYSPQRSTANESSNDSTETEYSSSSPSNLRQKNFAQLQDKLKPKKRQKKKKKNERNNKREPRQGTRQSPRTTTETTDDNKNIERMGTTTNARRALQV